MVGGEATNDSQLRAGTYIRHLVHQSRIVSSRRGVRRTCTVARACGSGQVRECVAVEKRCNICMPCFECNVRRALLLLHAASPM